MSVAFNQQSNNLEIQSLTQEFLSGHIFHERHMNSCPIGCKGCAVSASTTNKGAINFSRISDLYQHAASLDVSLNITKVEGYDPAFVKYADDEAIPFAETVKQAIDNGHTIITPVCTTGSWKNERSIWQMQELGKLSAKYRRYVYPSGRTGEAYTLSVPREINRFAGGAKYDQIMHIEKLCQDIELLTVNGEVDALVYFNSKLEGDKAVAKNIADELANSITQEQLLKTNIQLIDFNVDTLPESCMRYNNSVLLSDKGIHHIDQAKFEWNVD